MNTTNNKQVKHSAKVLRKKEKRINNKNIELFLKAVNNFVQLTWNYVGWGYRVQVWKRGEMHIKKNKSNTQLPKLTCKLWKKNKEGDKFYFGN